MLTRFKTRLSEIARDGLSPNTPRIYIFALCCVSVAAFADFAFEQLIPDITQSISYYPAIFLVTLFAGVRAGAVAAILSGAIEWWADTQYFGAQGGGAIQSINRGLYVATGALVIWAAVLFRHSRALNRQRSAATKVSHLPQGSRKYLHAVQKRWRHWVEASGWTVYAFALLCVTVATGLRFAFAWFGEDILPFAFFYPCILIVTLAGGVGAGLSAMALSLIVVGWAFVPPYYSIGLPTADQVIDCAMFLFASMLAMSLAERYRFASVRILGGVSAPQDTIAPAIVSLGGVLLTTLIALAMEPLFGGNVVIAAYLIPTVSVAVLYGSAVAMLTAFVCGLAAAYLIFPPKFSLYIDSVAHAAELATFMAVALILTWVVSSRVHRRSINQAPVGPHESRSLYFEGNSLRTQVGVLLIHSIGGSPQELKFVASGLASRGFTVSCCELAGHSGSEDDLLNSSWCDWFESVERAFAELAKRCSIIVVGGLSVGSILALRLAALAPGRVHGLCLFSPTLRYDGWAIPWYSFLLWLGVRAPFLRRMRFQDPPPYGVKDEATRALIFDAEPEAPHSAHPQTSLGTLQECHWLVRDVTSRLASIRTPALIIHPREDDVSDISNAIFLERHLGGPVQTLVLDDSYHLITVDRQQDIVMERTASFISLIERSAINSRPQASRPRPTIVAGAAYRPNISEESAQ